jgi:large subunit ribosomal protein L13
MAVIDATDHILGRLSTHIAKRLLKGEEIVVVNAQGAVLSGSRAAILEEFQHRRGRAGHVMKRKGPYYPRRPDRILRRTVRGMLPHQQPKGRDAYRRLKVYVGVPDEFEGMEPESIPEAIRPGRAKLIRLGEISEVLGYKG